MYPYIMLVKECFTNIIFHQFGWQLKHFYFLFQLFTVLCSVKPEICLQRTLIDISYVSSNEQQSRRRHFQTK